MKLLEKEDPVNIIKICINIVQLCKTRFYIKYLNNVFEWLTKKSGLLFQTGFVNLKSINYF